MTEIYVNGDQLKAHVEKAIGQEVYLQQNYNCPMPTQYDSHTGDYYGERDHWPDMAQLSSVTPSDPDLLHVGDGLGGWWGYEFDVEVVAEGFAHILHLDLGELLSILPNSGEIERQDYPDTAEEARRGR